MKTLMTMATLLLAGLALVTTGCGDKPEGGGGENGGQPKAAPMTKLTWTGIPDGAASDLAEQGKLLSDYLAKQLGVPVEFSKVDNYKQAVDALLSKKVDLVWFGGNTTIEAEEQGKGNVELVACRDIDLKFVSYFIANPESAAKIGKVNSLADLKDKAKDLRLQFGADKSTSGHLMPRYFLTQAGFPSGEEDLKAAFKSVAYAATGGHATTQKHVAEGVADIGALNYAYYDKSSDEMKAKTPIVYKTPEYVDYCFVARKDLGAENIEKIRGALTAVTPAANADLLAAWGGAKGFVKADPAKWEGIRQIRKDLGWAGK